MASAQRPQKADAPAAGVLFGEFLPPRDQRRQGDGTIASSGFRELARRAERNYAVVSLDRLDGAATSGDLRRWTDRGLLERAHRGVYRIAGAPRSPQGDLLAAVEAAGRMAAAGHRSASALWGLLPDWPVTPEIVIPVQRRARLHGVLVHRSVDLVAAHITTRHGIPTTNPLVTVLDLGAVVPADVVATAINKGASLRLFRPAAIEATLARLGRQGRNGVRTVREALTLLPVGRRPSDGMLELRFAMMARQFGIVGYEFQYPVRGTRIRIDFAFPQVRLAIEVDDYETHGTPMGFVHDRQRQNALVVLGWTVLRFTFDDVTRRPALVAAQILDVLRTLSDRRRP